MLRLSPREAARAILLVLGGKGSGNFGHEGRPGQVGGSGDGGGSEKGPVKNLKVYRGGVASHGALVSYSTTNKKMAESYVAMSNDRHGSGGSLHELSISINKPAPESVIEKAAKRAGIDNEYNTPASVFDAELHGEAAVKRLVDDLQEQGYDGAILPDIAYGEQIEDDAYITFNTKPAPKAPAAKSPTAKIDRPRRWPGRGHGGRMTDEEYEEAMRKLRGLGGKGSGNFGHEGRPGKVGGSGDGDGGTSNDDWDSLNKFEGRYDSPFDPKDHYKHGKLFFHGTVDQAAASIREQGLVPGGGRGGDSWALEKSGRPREAKIMIGSRKASVFLTTDSSVAEEYVGKAREMNPGSGGLLLAVRVPESARYSLMRDEHDILAFRFEKPIPPEWIRVVQPDGSLRRLAKKDDTFYIVIPTLDIRDLGGKGSGNFGHGGRPGQVGGSSDEGGERSGPRRIGDTSLSHRMRNFDAKKAKDAVAKLAGEDGDGPGFVENPLFHDVPLKEQSGFLEEARRIERIINSPLDDGQAQVVMIGDIRSPQLDVEKTALLQYIDNPHTIERTADPIRAVEGKNGTFWLLDGNHRVNAAKLGGVTTIKLRVHRPIPNQRW